MDQHGTAKSLSSLLESKRGKDSSQLEDILPANRSSLMPFKENQDFKLKYSSSLFCNEKKLLIPRKKNIQHQVHEMIDLTGKSSLDETSSREELLLPCSAKKRKVFNTEHSTGKIENIHEHASSAERSKSKSNDPSSPHSLVKIENPHISDDRSRQTAQVSSALPHKDDWITQKGNTEFLTQKNKGVHSAPVPRGEEEKKGSAFLVQVKCF